MLSPRWRKLVRDVQLTRWRFLLMVLASAGGMFAFAIMLTSSQILERETVRNYRATNPASATLTLSGIDAALLDKVRRQPGIAQAEAGAMVRAVLHSAGGAALPLTIFVVQDFAHMQIDAVYREAGAWPPPAGTLLLEREALRLIGGRIGASVSVQNGAGVRTAVAIGGTMHDPALPPANRGQTVYAYAAPATVNALGLDGALRQLKVTVSDQAYQRPAVEAAVARLAVWLRAQGLDVLRIRIPPPGEHPHHKIMSSIQGMLLLFSAIGLVLSAVLNATLLGAMLSHQTRQIGIMKTIGASSGQIAGMYLALVLCIGLLSAAVGAVGGVVAGRAFAEFILVKILNFSMASGAIPAMSYALMAAAGLLLPLLAALAPIMLATRTTVQAAIGHSGASRQHYSTAAYWLERLPFASRSLLLALRNSLRRRSRLALTLVLLTTAGAIFIASLNVRAAAEASLRVAAAARLHDMEITLSQVQDSRLVERLIGAVPGVTRVETWPRNPAAAARSDGLQIERTYRDGDHGALSLSTVPDHTAMLNLPLLQGRWLGPGELGTMVLNSGAAFSFFPGAKVGDEIPISTDGKTLRLRLVGIAQQTLAPAMMFVTPATYRAATGQGNSARSYRVIVDSREAGRVDDVTRAIERSLAAAQIGTRLSVTEAMMRKDVDGHFDLIIFALQVVAVVMALVGAVGLGSALGANVAERSREFGIMRTIGATPGTILRNVLGEGLLVGLVSVPPAVLGALLMSAGVGIFLGELLFGVPISPVLSPLAVGQWLALVLAGSAIASYLPARQAAHGTIQLAFARV